MFTCFLQYLLLTPTYINILNVYAFCNTHDITWGTKGDDKPEKLPAVTQNSSGTVDLVIPADSADLNAQYEAELAVFATRWEPPKKAQAVQEKQEDYYKGIRSGCSVIWHLSRWYLTLAVSIGFGSGNHQVVSRKRKGSYSAPRSTWLLCCGLSLRCLRSDLWAQCFSWLLGSSGAYDGWRVQSILY
jgi:hypothetical protein